MYIFPKFVQPLFQRHNRIKSIMNLFLFFVLVITIVLIFLLSYIIFSNIILQDVQQSRIEVLEQVSEKVDKLGQSISIVSNLYYYNDTLHTIVETNPLYLNDSIKLHYYYRLKTLNQEYQNAMIYFEIPYYCILICDNTYKYVSNNRISTYDFQKYLDQPWIEDVVRANGGIQFISPFYDTINERDVCTVLFARTVKDSMAENVGFLFLAVEEDAIRKCYEEIDSEICIVNANREVISANNAEMIGKDFTWEIPAFQSSKGEKNYITRDNGERYLYTYCEIKSFDLYIVERIPMKVLLAPMKKGILFISGISFVLLVAIFYLFSKLLQKITKPMELLSQRLDDVSKGNFEIHFPKDGYQEIRQIHTATENMTFKIKELLENIQTKEEQKRIMEMNFLQSQISPHFMYNTLFSAKCMIDLKQNKNASAMLGAYCNYLRRILSDKNIFISIKEESRFLEEYINIMKYRYGELFQTEMVIDETIGDERILKFLLQPLIENSIFHGFAETNDRPYRLKIHFYVANDLIVAEVEDNGIGFAASGNYLSKELRNEDIIGLANVQERLNLYYGANAVLKVSTNPEKTVVAICYPKRNEGDNEHADFDRR